MLISAQCDTLSAVKPGVFFDNPYSTGRERSALFATYNLKESLTQQSDKDDCDINIIMKKYGGAANAPKRIGTPLYGDFTKVTNFQTAREMLDQANEAFRAIPADIRKRFDHDPAKFIDFIQDPNNQDDLVKLGLKEKPSSTANTSTVDAAAPGANSTPTTANATAQPATSSTPGATPPK